MAFTGIEGAVHCPAMDSLQTKHPSRRMPRSSDNSLLPIEEGKHVIGKQVQSMLKSDFRILLYKF